MCASFVNPEKCRSNGWDKGNAKCSAGNEQIWVLQVPSAGLCTAADLPRDMQACCSLCCCQMHHWERRRSESLTRHFLRLLPGCQALRVCGVVCNGHLMAQNRLWAGKPPCCLLTTIASNGLSPGRDLHLGSDHAALRRRACHLCSSCVVRARTEGQITLSWREVTSVQGFDLLCRLLQTVPVHGFAAA